MSDNRVKRYSLHHREEQRSSRHPTASQPPSDAEPAAEGRTDRLLYSRRQVAHLLGGVSVSSVIRLEKRGKLKGVRLTAGCGLKFFNHAEVMALVKGARP